MRLFRGYSVDISKGGMFMNWDQIGNWFVMFLSGCGVALEIFAVTLVCAIPLGVLLSFGRRSKYKVISWPVSLYISIMRGTPLLLQLLFVYFAPKYMFGLNYDRFLAALIAFVLNYAAYFAEIFRGGILAIPKGQYEAAKMLKLSSFQTIRYIILPQVVKIVLPSIFNEIINLVKDSSLVYVLGVGDLLLESRTAANRDATLAPMFVAGAIYLILVGLVTVASKNIEKKFNYYK
mgnify:CR=1 FL=1